MDRVDYQSLVIQDIINLANKGELNLTPWYQRRSVWNKPQQSYLVNTLFEKKPLPAIYIRHSLDLQKGISIKEVVDGQQRTNAIISYCNNDYSARHPHYKKLMKFSDLKGVEKQDLLLTSIPVGYLLGATDSDVIDIFARINSVSKTLNTQEKRNAIYSGEFKQFCVKESVSRTDFWKEYKIFTGNEIARMNEVQFMSDVIINLLEGLTDFNQNKINKYYKNNDENFSEMENIDKKLDNIFDTIVSLNPDSIKQTIFSRQPIFFSLIIAIDKLPKISIKKIEKGITEIDNRFNSDKPLTERSKEDANFYNACSASTQRLNNRTIRDKYIYNYLS